MPDVSWVTPYGDDFELFSHIRRFEFTATRDTLREQLSASDSDIASHPGMTLALHRFNLRYWLDPPHHVVVDELLNREWVPSLRYNGHIVEINQVVLDAKHAARVEAENRERIRLRRGVRRWLAADKEAPFAEDFLAFVAAHPSRYTSPSRRVLTTAWSDWLMQMKEMEDA